MLLVTDSRCLDHRPPLGMPESPRRLESLFGDGPDSLVAALSASGSAERLFDLAIDTPPGWPAPIEGPGFERAIQAVHTERYLHRLRAAIERGDGLIDSADNPLSDGTWRATAAASRAAIEAASFVAAGGEPVFVAVRPPGHHALADAAMGFCYLNHVAVAAQYLLDHHGLERVAIVDFDVHHGNGTQAIFYDTDRVFYGSLHQFPFYPGTGAAAEIGSGAGVGATLNVPLPAGVGPETWLEAVDDHLLPALSAYAPQALLLSAGFDAWRDDPLGGMRLDREAYRDLGRRFAAFSAAQCEGRLWAMLEGGYDTEALPGLVASFVEGVRDAPAASK